MKIVGPLISGHFVERPNRFLTLVEVNGEIVRSHLPDPGRLKELLVPGAVVFLRSSPPGSNRKTAYTTVMVKHQGQLISLVSVLANFFVKESLTTGVLPMFRDFTLVKQEITVGRHRFDFLLKNPRGNPFYLEVKSVTYVKAGIARFPDAVTTRGARHARALQNLVKKGTEAGVLFVCQRSDAVEFRIMWDRDPNFGMAILKAQHAGVKVWCVTLNISKCEVTFSREIPVNLHLESITYSNDE